MQELKRDTDVFSNIGYINLDGTGFDVDNNVLNRADREYFKRAVQTQKTVISEPVISSITGKVVVVIAVPVKDNGVLKGIIAGTVGLSNFDETLASMATYKTGQLVVADESGLVIIHPNEQQQSASLTSARKYRV